MIYDKVAVPGNSGSASFGKIYFPADCCEPSTYKISKSEPEDEKLSPKKTIITQTCPSHRANDYIRKHTWLAWQN